jgi:MoaA/NifB/PqqE/SkfB family radical SAM enzyme
VIAHEDGVLTGDSFFHLAAYGEPLPGLNLCGAGRVVCLIDPVGDVYACPVRHPRAIPGRKHPARRRIRYRMAAF